MAEQYGFFVDSTRCIKCWACEVACKQWHEIPAGTHSRRTVHERWEGTFPNTVRKVASLACMHCEEPACVEVCPMRAVTKREEDGLVTVDRAKCIGCRCCALACPFDIPRYTGEHKLMDKCDGCHTLRKTPQDEPRCVITCPTRALHFGPLDEMAALARAKGGRRVEGPTSPSVYLAEL